MRTGLAARGVRTHERYAPRAITYLELFANDGRYVANRDEVVAAIIATGLPYRIVGNFSRLPFEEQVRRAAASTASLQRPRA
jgi:hypothetical protein